MSGKVRYQEAYNDSFGVLETAIGGAAQWTIEQYWDTGFLSYKLRHDQNDFFQLKTQFDHTRKLATVLGDMHIHITPLAATPGDIYLSIAYHWHTFGDVIPQIVSWQATNATIPILAADQFKYLIKPLGVIINPPASEGYSSSLLMKVTRLGTNLLDTYSGSSGDGGTAAANVVLWYMDAHTLQNRFGSIGTATD